METLPAILPLALLFLLCPLLMRSMHRGSGHEAGERDELARLRDAAAAKDERAADPARRSR